MWMTCGSWSTCVCVRLLVSYRIILQTRCAVRTPRLAVSGLTRRVMADALSKRKSEKSGRRFRPTAILIMWRGSHEPDGGRNLALVKC